MKLVLDLDETERSFLNLRLLEKKSIQCESKQEGEKKKKRLCAEEMSSVCFLCSPTWKVLSVGKN